MRPILLLVLFHACAQAQSASPISLSAGVKLGAPINDPSSQNNVYSTYNQSRWTGGPAVELRLPLSFAVEVNALARSFRQSSGFPVQLRPDLHAYTATVMQKTNAWDFPLLLKYRFQVGSIRPFVSAGHSWSRESSESTTIYTCTGPQGSCRPAELPQELRGGSGQHTSTQRSFVTGAGIEFRTRHLTLSPELRFSHPTSGGPRDNRFTALVGFSFGGRR
jgi:hypothetical protein